MNSISIAKRPRLLRDFLTDESNSFSSTDFKSLSRNPLDTTVRNLLELDLIPNKVATSKLLRSQSRTASMAFSAIHRASERMINAVKHLPIRSVKSPSVLPRSISRRLSKRKNDTVREISVTVKVRDILRWKSFRDLIEDKPPPLDFASSPHRCTTTTTTTESTSTSASSHNSSWCDSDFTSENLPFWCSKSISDDGDEVDMGKKCLTDCSVGGDFTKETTGETVDPKGEFIYEEKEQHSPVSVLDFPFGDQDEEQESGAEEKVRQLLNQVVERASSVDSIANVDTLLFDFFSHELTTCRDQKQNEFDCEMVRVAQAWVGGQDDEGKSLAWKVESNRDAYSRDMESIARWNKFEEEQNELALDVEIGVLSYLVDELLADLSIP